MKSKPVVRRGDTVIWLHGGQEGVDDGLPARVHKVYAGGSTVDLLVENQSGQTSSRNTVPHLSDRSEVPENRVIKEGLWRSIEEHHAVFEALEKERIARLKAAQGKDKKSKLSEALS